MITTTYKDTYTGSSSLEIHVNETNTTKCKEMKMECNEMKPGYEYHLSRSKLQESVCERDLRVDTASSLLAENHTRKVVKDVSYRTVIAKIYFKYMD